MMSLGAETFLYMTKNCHDMGAIERSFLIK